MTNSEKNKTKCSKCVFHGVWHENGIETGYVCKHPDIKSQRGLMYGKYYSKIENPKWCPIK